MNSPYGSFDYPTNPSGSDTGWESTPSTDGDWSFCNADFSAFPEDFATIADFAPWTTSSAASLTAPQNAQYDFSQGQQVFSVLDTQIDWPAQTTSASTATSNQIYHDSELTYFPHNGAIAPTTPPLLSGLGIPADHHCTLPRNTAAAADHHHNHSVAPDELRALFPSPILPRIEPPCLYDDADQPLQKQNPRFEGDMYAALWIRGEGIERAGWCGFCPSWHKLKDSAYWYHLHYTHGIACHSGRPLDPPRKLRLSRPSNGLEALCGTCNDWISIGKGVKLRTAYWRHAYKCLPKQAVRSPRRAAVKPEL